VKSCDGSWNGTCGTDPLPDGGKDVCAVAGTDGRVESRNPAIVTPTTNLRSRVIFIGEPFRAWFSTSAAWR